MFENYKHLIIVVAVTILLHQFVVNRTVENMAPVGHVQVPYWVPGQECMTPQELIDLRNSRFECNATNKFGCAGHHHSIPMDHIDEYTGENYNPAHFDHNCHESKYTTRVGDKGQQMPDKFAGVTYN